MTRLQILLNHEERTATYKKLPWYSSIYGHVRELHELCPRWAAVDAGHTTIEGWDSPSFDRPMVCIWYYSGKAVVTEYTYIPNHSYVNKIIACQERSVIPAWL